MPKLADFRGVHYGEAMLVCGLGHSILRLKNPQRFTTIGVNDIGRAFTPNYLFVMDKPESFGEERFQYIRESQAQYIFTDHDLGMQHDNIVRFPIRRSDVPKLDDPNALYFTGRPPTSPLLGLCLAAHMGAKAIGLVGVDFTDHHFFRSDGAHRLVRSLDGIDKRYYLLGNALLDQGVKIFNISSESRLSAFPRLSANQFYNLQRSGNTRSWSRPVRRVCLVSETPINDQLKAIARNINSETLQSCRLIAPGSPDIESNATPEIELHALENSDVTVNCKTLKLPKQNGNDFQDTWAKLRPALFGNLESNHTNGYVRRLSMSVILSQESATGEELAQTLRSLWPDLVHNDELIVIGRRGDDQAPDWLRNPTRFTYVEQVPGESFIAARNRIAALSRKNILVFCDANTAPPRHWADSLLFPFASPTAAAVGPAIADMYKHESKGFGMQWTDAELNTAWLPQQNDKPYPVPLLPGMFLAVRRPIFKNIGGFDAGMRGSGGDDVELCFRLWTAGYQCVVNPKLVVPWMNPYAVGAVHIKDYWEDLLHNLLRLSTLHFSSSRLAAFIEKVGADPSFSSACETLLRSDLGRTRLDRKQKRKHSDRWFFNHVANDCFNSSERHHTI
ncbi:MAG: glycosyltransferase [Acidobacteriaceae bacterium]